MVMLASYCVVLSVMVSRIITMMVVSADRYATLLEQLRATTVESRVAIS
jgi:hypothetical protein